MALSMELPIMLHLLATQHGADGNTNKIIKNVINNKTLLKHQGFQRHHHVNA